MGKPGSDLVSQRRRAMRYCPDLLRRLDELEGRETNLSSRDTFASGPYLPDWVVDARRGIMAEILEEFSGAIRQWLYEGVEDGSRGSTQEQAVQEIRASLEGAGGGGGDILAPVEVPGV